MFSQFIDLFSPQRFEQKLSRLKTCLLIFFISFLCIFSFNPVSGQSKIPYLEEGVNAFINSDYFTCLEYYKDHLHTRENLQDNQKHSLLLRIAFITAWSGQLPEAYKYLEEADELELAGVSPDSTSKSDRSLTLAISEYNNNHLTKAADKLLESKQWRIASDPFEEAILANTYGFLGLISKDLEDNETAVGYYEESIRINRKLNRSFALADELTGLAISRMAIDPFDPRIEQALEESLQIFRNMDSPLWQDYVNNEYSNLFRLRNNIPKALDYVLEIARNQEINKDTVSLHITYNNIGALYEDMNKLDSSIIYIRKAISTAKNQNKSTSGESYSNLGKLFGQLGYQDSALFYFEKAIKELMPASSTIESDATLYSVVYPQLPDYIVGKANAYYELFHQTKNIEDLKQSISSYELALHQIDTLRSFSSFESKPHAVRDNRKYFFLALQSAAECYEYTRDSADLETAFLFASRSKALIFDEYLRVNESRGFLDANPSLSFKDDSLKMKKASILQKVFEYSYPGSNNDSLTKYKSLRFEIDEALVELNKEIREQNPAYYKSVHTLRAFPSKEIRSKLSVNELLIDYTWYGNQIIVMLIGHENFFMHNIDAPEDLRETLGTYRDFLERKNKQLSFREYQEYSYDLYSILIKPFESIINDKELFLISDDSLALLPFETLLYEPDLQTGANFAKLPLLLKKNAISYFHSIQQFVLSTENTAQFTTGVSAFAPFDKIDYNDGSGQLNSLVGSAEESKAIKKYFPGQVYLGRKASEEKFRDALLEPRIIHIATHGLQADSTPLQNHLLFYPRKNMEDFKFHLFELLGMQIKSPLVVLSSCNTGAGTLQPGEGVLSLARAFHYAGTPSLVMSQWPVDDAAAVTIMDEFYACIKKGYPLNQALQEAKLAYLSGSSKVRGNPYYWASFQLTGFPGSIIIENNGISRWIIYTGAGVLLLISILLIVRFLYRKNT